MLTGWHPAYFSLGAALLMAVLGVVVLARHPSRGVNRAFFALMVLNAGGRVLTAGNALAPGSELGLTAVRTFWYIDPLLSAALVILALHVPTSSAFLLKRPIGAHAAVLAVPVAFTIAYTFDHTLFIVPQSLDGTAYYALTPLGSMMFVLRGVAIAAVLVIFARKFRTTPHALQKTQIAWATAAVIIGFIPFLGLQLTGLVRTVPANPAVVGLGIALVAAHGSAIFSLRPFDASLFKDDNRQIVFASYAAGLALTLSLVLLGAADPKAFFAAIASLAYPVLLAYAILKFDLFGLDLRLRQAAPHFTLAFFLAATFAFFASVAAQLSPAVDASRLFLVAGVLTAASAVPIHRATTRLATRMGWSTVIGDGAVAERRLEVYRAAVENSFTRGEHLDQSATLQDLRGRLDLSTRDHRLMVQAVMDAANADPKRPRGPLREGDFVMRKYRVVRFLGSGSFGRALLAEHAGMGRQVVIKEPHESYRSRTALQQLSKEARLAARVQHPNVVALYDFEEHEDTGYLVFEYVPGGSLEERLKPGPLPREEAYRVFERILRGLDAVHDARIVHMDLKPSNILLDAEGNPKITDFGIANELRVEATLARSIGGQAHPGTLLYMAPEQVRGRRDPGPRADLYAAGAILHEMLTGARYLDFPDSPILIQEAIMYKEPRLDDPRLKPSEQDLLAALLAKAPADRPGSAREVLARLEADLAQNFKRAEPDSMERRALREA